MMKSTLKATALHFLAHHNMELVSVPRLDRDYSNMGEQSVIQEYLAALRPANRFFVDIGASWGVETSNTLHLAQSGWSGLAAEYAPDKFARLARNWRDFPVSLHRGRVTPENVVPLFRASEVPTDFAFLSLDIDSWDAHVLESLLSVYRPFLVCAEVNETIPPPVKFSVAYSDAPLWNGGNFMGASVSYMADVARRAGYTLLKQQYNNIFLAPRECGLPGLTPEAAYASGYRDKADRDAKFPYNAWMASLWDLTPEEMLHSVQERFAGQSAPYLLHL